MTRMTRIEESEVGPIKDLKFVDFESHVWDGMVIFRYLTPDDRTVEIHLYTANAPREWFLIEKSCIPTEHCSCSGQFRCCFCGG